MITYELAKKLKEAGYPWKLNLSDCKHKPSMYCGFCIPNPNLPTLSELIEACGFIHTGMDSFKLELMPLGPGWKASASRAVCYDEKDSRETNNFNSTPEEAVANLYLELNKK